MQKQKRTKTKNKKQNNTNTYKLDDYRTKRRQYEQQPHRESQNPYRTTQSSMQGEYGYANYRDPSYTRQTRQGVDESPEVRRQTIKKNNQETRQQVQKRKKRQQRFMIRRLILVGCIAAVTVYGGLQVMDSLSHPSISYQTVGMGTIDNGKQQTGIVVRQEEIVVSPREGDIHPIVGEGEKVAKGSEVCFVADDVKVAEALMLMSDLDEAIYDRQDKRDEYSYFQSELYQMNQAIEEEMHRVYALNYAETPTSIYQLKQALERAIQNRTTLYIEDKSELTQELQVKRTAIQEQLMTYQNTVNAAYSGVVSYVLDGYEALNFEHVDQMNYIQYSDLLEDVKAADVRTVATGLSDEPLLKLIQDDKWKIITYVDAEQEALYTEQQPYAFYFTTHSAQPVSFTLEQKVAEGDKIKLVFETDEKITSFLGTRYTTFIIGEHKAEGLKIPLKAIVEKNVMKVPNDAIFTKNHHKGVNVEEGDKTTFATVNIQYEKEGYSYVMQEIDNPEALQLGQTIQIMTETLSPGDESDVEKETYTVNHIESVQGVYVINSAYAQFKQIEIALTNDEHAILKKSTNTVVKEHDQIISNPKSIQEDQLLKTMHVTNR